MTETLTDDGDKSTAETIIAQLRGQDKTADHSDKAVEQVALEDLEATLFPLPDDLRATMLDAWYRYTLTSGAQADQETFSTRYEDAVAVFAHTYEQWYHQNWRSPPETADDADSNNREQEALQAAVDAVYQLGERTGTSVRRLGRRLTDGRNATTETDTDNDSPAW